MRDTAAIITAAVSQVGVPYAWGGEVAGQKFDCSGLTQWAYQQAGITLPRTSEAQYAALNTVSATAAQPGDLVFSEFGAQGQSGPGHVGVYLGGGKYLDAPFTGAKVRIDNVPTGAVYGASSSVQHDVTGAVTKNPTTGDYTAPAAGGSGGGVLSGVTTLVGDILHPSQLIAFWERLGMGLLGAMLFVVGLSIYFASTDAGQQTASTAASVAAVA